MPKWIRQGECNHCGFCCTFRFGNIPAFLKEPDEKQAELMKMLGFREHTQGDVKGLLKVAPVTAECPHHVDNRCEMYDRRPTICQEWPMEPKHVKNTPCSYWFVDEEGHEKPLGGEGSPYGTQTLAGRVLRDLEYRLKL